MPVFSTGIYSPRWGHEDIYKFEFTREAMIITMTPREAKCVWRENLDPQWEGEPLDRILRNDMIYAPTILLRLYEHLWMSWRNGDIKESEVDNELQAVTEWLNCLTQNKPKTDFWNKYF